MTTASYSPSGNDSGSNIFKDNLNETAQANFPDIKDDRTSWEIAICAIVLILILIIAVLGNSLVIAAIYTNRKLRENVSYMFIINLGISDLLMAMVVMTSSLHMLLFNWKSINTVWCDVVCAVNYCLIIVSMLTLSFISVERYYAVLQPLHYLRRVTKTKIISVLAYSWFQALVFAGAPIVKNWIHYDYWEVVCAIKWSESQTDIYVVCAFIFCFLCPGILMCICYFRIIKEVRRNKVSPTVGNTAEHRAQATNKKIIKSLITVVAIFFICMTSFCITKLLKVLSVEVPGYINLMSSFLAFTASATNPFIYGIFRPDFRNAYNRFLRKLKSHSLNTNSQHEHSWHETSGTVRHCDGSLKQENNSAS